MTSPVEAPNEHQTDQQHPQHQPKLLTQEQKLREHQQQQATMRLQHEHEQHQKQHLSRPASACFNNTTAGSMNNSPGMNISLQRNPPYMLSSNQIADSIMSQQHMPTATQHNLRMNQIMAPSMPNILHHSVHPGGHPHPPNISSSQSMQNVNMLHGNHNNYILSSHSNLNSLYHSDGYNLDLQQIQENQQTLDINQIARKHIQRQQDMMPMYSLNVNVQQQNSMPDLSDENMLLSPVGNRNDYTSTMPKSHSAQLNPNLVNRRLPPTAPKPQVSLARLYFI